MNITFQKLDEKAVLPTRGSATAAGLDLSACISEPVVIPQGEIRLIPTGLAAALDTDEAMLMICARSGLAAKFGITLANSVGIVDTDYRGELKVALINLGKDAFTVTPAMRIAQLIAVPVYLPAVLEADSLPETARGIGGFGSTGTH